jgi:hypothetical protein
VREWVPVQLVKPVTAVRASITPSTASVDQRAPTGGDDALPQREVREMPEPPRKYWRLVGPGIVAGGVGLSSGEFVLWPYIASQLGLVLLWGALVGVLTQFFLNMEIERYTLGHRRLVRRAALDSRQRLAQFGCAASAAAQNTRRGNEVPCPQRSRRHERP